LLNRGLPTMPDVLQSSISNNISTSVLGSGEMIGNYTIKDGYFQSSNFVSGSAGWQLSPTGAEINVSTAILSLDIPDKTTANSFHVESDADSYWGCNVADFATNNDNAKAYILKTGVAKLQDVSVVGTISGRSTATIASAINASGHFIDANLDTSGKTMLKGFDFGTTDYQGALKSGDIAWNTTTGAITGGSGVLVYRGGIIGAKAGVAQFTLSASTGNATFAGSLSGASGTFGTITAGAISGVTITASTLQTGTTGNNVDITQGRISQRTGTTEVVYSDVGAYGGWWGLKDTSGNAQMAMYVDDADDNIRWRINSGDLYIQPDGNIYFAMGSSTSIKPTSDNTTSFGDSSHAWTTVWSYNYVDRCNIYDDLDDIAILRSIKAKGSDKYGHKKMDLNSLPEFLTSRRNGVKTAKVGRNLGRYVDLLAGAIKQLDDKVEKMKNDKS